MAISSALVNTTIPARLDRLRWGRFHTLVVVALGITWILDGLEVTLAGAVSPALKESPRLYFSNADVGFVSSAYVAGAVLSAIFFGWLTDRLGRKRGIGVLTTLAESDPEVRGWFTVFQVELQKLGWEQGRNISIEYRWPGSDEHRLRTGATELVGMTPDVLFTAGTPALVALSRETRSLPIVFCASFRSGRTRSRCKSGSSGREHYRVCYRRKCVCRQMAGTAPGHGSRQEPSGGHSRPG